MVSSDKLIRISAIIPQEWISRVRGTSTASKDNRDIRFQSGSVLGKDVKDVL